MTKKNKKIIAAIWNIIIVAWNFIWYSGKE